MLVLAWAVSDSRLAGFVSYEDMSTDVSPTGSSSNSPDL